MFKVLNRILFVLMAMVLFSGPQFALAQQASSNNYSIDEIFMGPGGSNDVSSTNYIGSASIADTVAGITPSDAMVTNASTDVITNIDGTDYRVVTWTSSGSVSFSSPTSVDYLIIAGGGGGAGNCLTCGGAGGGGAGGYLSGSTSVTNQNYNISVGNGGNGGQAATNSASANGSNGGNSSAFSLTAIGGGGGRPQSGAAGASGGSGGGGSAGASPGAGAGGAGTVGQGNNGATGQNSTPWYGGGGGGAGSAGSAPGGGNGLASSITGTSVTRAGGGAGGTGNTTFQPLGGTGGGGNGGNNSFPNGANGAPSTGSGGGGANGIPNGGRGGDGGSGIVIVRWVIDTSGTSAIGGNTTSANPELEVTLATQNIDMGVFSSESPSTGTATFSVRTYLASGYVVYSMGTPPTATSGRSIAPMTNGGTSSPGTEQFGINLVANTSPSVGSNPAQIPDTNFSFGTVASNYASANNFRYNSGDIIAQSNSSSGITTYTISYLVNINDATTPAGQYIFRHSIVVTSTF